MQDTIIPHINFIYYTYIIHSFSGYVNYFSNFFNDNRITKFVVNKKQVLFVRILYLPHMI